MFHAGHMYCHFPQETYCPLFIKAIDEQPLERKIPRCQDYQRIASGAPPQMDRGLYHNPLNCRSISTGKRPLTPRPILWCPYFWTHMTIATGIQMFYKPWESFFSQRKPWTQFFSIGRKQFLEAIGKLQNLQR